MKTTVDGRETTEITGFFREWHGAEVGELAKQAIRDDEFAYYERISDEIADIVLTDALSQGEEPEVTTSRRLIFIGKPLDCITSIQLLLGRGDGNTLVVFQRSSDEARWQSDIGFLARLALKYNCHKLSWLAGSVHRYK